MSRLSWYPRRRRFIALWLEEMFPVSHSMPKVRFLLRVLVASRRSGFLRSSIFHPSFFRVSMQASLMGLTPFPSPRPRPVDGFNMNEALPGGHTMEAIASRRSARIFFHSGDAAKLPFLTRYSILTSFTKRRVPQVSPRVQRWPQSILTKIFRGEIK